MNDGEITEYYIDTVSSDHETIAASEIMDTLGERLKTGRQNDKVSASDKIREMTAAGNAISQQAQKADNPQKVLNATRDAAGDVAQMASIKKERVIGIITDAVGNLEEQDIEEAGECRVDHGIGLDRMLEYNLEEVVIQRSTDAVDDPVLTWAFDQGERVETRDGVHLSHYHLFKKIDAATNRRLVTELASEKVEDSAETAEEFAQKSLGPKDRPWSRKKDLWTRSITGLVKEKSRTETSLGPRTEAWENIQARIDSGRGVRNLDDAVAQGMIHVAEDLDEIWIPTSMVADAVESIETSRRALQSELTERGIDTNKLSGGGISEAVTAGGSTSRFWRLDATYEDVPEPETVLDEAKDPTERSADVNSRDISASADEPETFGRDPDSLPESESNGNKDGKGE